MSTASAVVLGITQSVTAHCRIHCQCETVLDVNNQEQIAMIIQVFIVTVVSSRQSPTQQSQSPRRQHSSNNDAGYSVFPELEFHCNLMMVNRRPAVPGPCGAGIFMISSIMIELLL